MSLTKVTYSMIDGAVANVIDYGAIGDGVTNCTTAIQAAIDYLDSQGGGILVFPQGTYGISSTIFVKDNITLQGEGRPEIKALSAMNGAMIQFGFTTGVVTDPPTNPCSNAELNGFVINADYKVSKTSYGTGLDSGVVYVWRLCPYNKIIDCEIKSAECGLVEVEDGADFFQLKNCEIHDITSTSVVTQFQNLVNVDGPTNAVIDNNNIYDLKISGYSPTSWGYAIRLHATDSSVVSNNKCDTGYYVVLVDGRSNTIISNRLTNPANTGITIFQNDFGCRYNSIINNFIDNDTTASGTVGFGIREALSGTSPDSAKVTNNYIAGNTIANAGTPLVILNTSQSISVGNTSITGNPDDGTAGYAPTLNTISDTIKSGTYTPTLSNINNITSSTAYLSQYLVVNGVVTVSGKVDITPTGLGSFDLRLTVPILTTFADNSQAGGTAHDAVDQSACVQSQPTGSTVRIQGVFTGSTARSWWFTFTYRIV